MPLLVLWSVVDWTDGEADEYDGGVVLRDSSGSVLRVSLGENDVDCRPYYSADREDWIVKAIIASEDGAFWSHNGIRPLSILRACYQNLVSGKRVSGACTISMQVVRLIKPHPKSLFWKAVEAVKAMKMERRKDKLWIMSQYLNRAPFGSNFVGIEAAANGWFGKSAKDLGIGEAAMLAGMVQAPSRFRLDRHYERALKRREYVLSRMMRLGMISEEQFEGAKGVVPTICRSPRPFAYPYYCDWVLRHMGHDKSSQKAYGDYVTALDPDIQRHCETLVSEASVKGGYRVSAVVMKAESGEVVAISCSGNYFSDDAGQYNTVLSLRPAGSTLKPFLAALALERGVVNPDERLQDVPQVYKGYRPANFDSTYRGSVTLGEALVLSLNLPFVTMLHRIGIRDFGMTLQRLGFSGVTGDVERYGLGMAIGNVEVSLLELVDAYASLARGGIWKAASAVKGEHHDGTRIFSEGVSYVISEILSGEERTASALGHIADVPLPRFAWKTGTSAAYRDAWTVAWNPEYVVGVWCGHISHGFGDRTLVGAKAATPVAWRIIRTLYPQGEGPWFAKPDTVKFRPVCRLSGRPANGDCPDVMDGAFIERCSSPALCSLHYRDLEGRVAERKPVKEKSLSISSPADGSEYRFVEGMGQQKIVCRAIGNAEGSRLWWFLDGRGVGETVGGEPFLLDPGSCSSTNEECVVTCADGNGASSSVTLKISHGGNR